MGFLLCRSSSGIYAVIRTGCLLKNCAHLKSSRYKPEHSDSFMMYVIGLINTSRQTCFLEFDLERADFTGLLGDNMIIFLTSQRL